MLARSCRLFQSKSSWSGHIIADLCVTPLGEGASVRKHVLEVHNLLRSLPGIKTKLHAYGTNIEGDWTAVMAAVRAAHERLHATGVVRVSSNMRFGSRTDKIQSLDDKTKHFPSSSCCWVHEITL